MPSLFGSSHGHHSPGLSILSGSRSRPVSRPASPTAAAFSNDDPLNDYFSGAVPVPAGNNRPPISHAGSSAFSYVSDGVASTPHTPVGSYSASTYASSLHGGSSSHPPLEIVLDSDNLVLRGQGGDLNPAYLSGHLSLWLNESTNVKDITMNLTGKAKVHYTEASTHNYTHSVVHHDWSFLDQTNGKKGKTQTLKAGHHTFPFSFTLDGNLPASFTTFTGDGDITYKLRATVVRSGLAFNLSAARTFEITRSFTQEALEFNQTLEIENTWPGKIMYSITIPFKAYAAGDDIPVLVKFMPLAKGVRVLSVSSVIKEYSLVQTRTSSHADTRVAIAVKHEIQDGKAVQVEREVTRPPAHWHGTSLVEWSRANSASNTQPPTPPSETQEPNNDSSASLAGTDVNVGDDEVSTSFTVPIPPWTTPSHSVKPVFVNHKIKWSCSISNADGHISELRCALPIIILGNSILDEARTNSAATRALLVNGEVDQNAAAQVDLPSYSNHVYDRLAVTEASAGSSGFSSVAGWRSVNATPHHSPSHTPPTSRPPSRPASPVHGSSRNSVHEAVNDLPPRRQLELGTEASLLRSLGNLAGPSGEQEANGSGGHSGHHSGAHSGPHSQPMSGHSTPPDSFAMSREGSRSRTTSRAGSRAGSRASSPERGHGESRPSASRRSTGLGGLLHLPTGLKPLSALGGKSPILRNGTGSGGPSAASSPILAPNSPSTPNIGRNVSFISLSANGGVSTSNSRQSAVTIAPSAFQRPERLRRSSTAAPGFLLGGGDTPDGEDEDVGRLSRVPSYTDNRDAFVVPLDPSLPSYADSEQEIVRARSHIDLMRARSDTALADLGSAAATAAEVQASEAAAEAEGTPVAAPATVPAAA